MVLDVVKDLKNGYKYTLIMNKLSQMVRLKEINDANELARLISELNNNLRLWELKGYTPNEIHNLMEKPSLVPLPKKTAEIRKAAVGRNDLCPCVSGKKYKKCCMN